MTAGVAILLCTFNGSTYLEEQLNSIATQDCAEVIRIYASDDNSSDNTQSLLRGFSALPDSPDLHIRPGPERGHVANFFSLICAEDIDAEYFSYADQDDVWDCDKLSRAITALSKVATGRPALYCSRTRSIDSRAAQIGLSPLFERPLGFANALVHNVGGGNTMVLNKAARELLRTVGEVDVVSHDWWTYLLISAAGGALIYDPNPGIGYRQHEKNLIGSNSSWPERLQRFRFALKGRVRQRNDRNLHALQQASGLFTRDNKLVFDEFRQARSMRLIPRLRAVQRAGLYAQTRWGNLGLFAATLLNRI